MVAWVARCRAGPKAALFSVCRHTDREPFEGVPGGKETARDPRDSNGYATEGLLGMRRINKKIYLAVLLSGAACGPSSGSSSSGGDGNGDGEVGGEDPPPDVGAEGSTGESTGATGGCGDGIIDEGEWCYERHEIINEHTDRMLRVMPGLDEANEAFVLWSRGLVSVTSDGSEILFRKYYEGSGGVYQSNGEVFSTRIEATDQHRADYVFWLPEAGISNECLSAFVLPGPSRTPTSNLSIHQLECDRDGVLAPVGFEGAPDGFLGLDETTGLAALYKPEPLDGWSPFEVGVYVTPTVTFDAPACQSFLSAPGKSADGEESVFILGKGCADDAGSILMKYSAVSEGTSIEEELFDTAIPADVQAIKMADLNGDHADDVIMIGDGFAQVQLQNPDGTFQPAPAPDVAVSGFVPYEAATPAPMEPIHRLQTGEFDNSPGEEVVVHTTDGLAVISHTGDSVHTETFDLPVTGFAAADINGDSLSDLAVLHSDRITFLLSIP